MVSFVQPLQTILSIFITVATVICIIYLVCISYPKIRIDFYTQHDPVYFLQPDLFNISMEYGVPRDICFRVTNYAEPVLSYFIPASNTKAFITTDIQCDQCNSYIDIGRLDAQKNSDACKKVELSQKVANVSIGIQVTWNGLGKENKISKLFFCDLAANPAYHEYVYFCRLS
jgi:hypothetical protein